MRLLHKGVMSRDETQRVRVDVQWCRPDSRMRDKPHYVEVAVHVVVAGGGIREDTAVVGSLIGWIRGAGNAHSTRRTKGEGKGIEVRGLQRVHGACGKRARVCHVLDSMPRRFESQGLSV